MRAPSFANISQCYDENDRFSRPVCLIKNDLVRNPLHLHRREALNASQSTLPNPLKSSDRVPSTVGVGFNTNQRKRSAAGTQRDVAMSSYNSAFLSGLFADIAKANVSSEDEESRSFQTPYISNSNCPSPSKKSRISLTKSISRCEKSFGNLQMAATTTATPSTSTSNGPRNTFSASVTDSPVARSDSLSYQLHCVSSSSSNESDAVQTATIGKIAFPHLPATVSNSSCSNLASLTRRNSSQLSLESETDPNTECYGWFVNMDDDDDNNPIPSPVTVNPYNSSSSLSDLTFSAITAPKRTNEHDAQVEWAKAADTVDDVLGDFF